MNFYEELADKLYELQITLLFFVLHYAVHSSLLRFDIDMRMCARACVYVYR
jgi:hypothetical protein